MKALIIGGAGFVGKYLADFLKNSGVETYITKMAFEKANIKGVGVFDLDITEPLSIKKLLNELRPDHIYHLAAQSSVARSWADPSGTIEINVKGCLNLLEAIRSLDYKPRTLLIGSGEEYGHIAPSDIPVNEQVPIRPGNIYAATKASQNMLGAIYAEAYHLDVMMVRAFNHIGPGQAPMFVISDFCKQVAEIELGLKENVMKVGNLEAKRDFTDVRDVVRAYTLIMRKGEPGETYNVGSGKARSIRSILDTILSYADKKIKVETDPARMRPSDMPIIEADTTKLRDATDWHPVYDINETIKETLDYWRSVLSQNHETNG
ncbi:MAG: GDP-mannose 4,6-dehydratase [Lachnospiraceae bacterium]|nr:GDP-mannose 4,6-dehydratase [Lachnospiraceae bacterium]